MYDVKQSLVRYALDYLSGHVHQQEFKITKAANVKARVYYKKWSMTTTWSSPGNATFWRMTQRKAKLVGPDLSTLNLDKLKQGLPKYWRNLQKVRWFLWKYWVTPWWQPSIDFGAPETSISYHSTCPTINRLTWDGYRTCSKRGKRRKQYSV